MKLLDLLITAIALSMDAFAVSIGKGLSVKRLKASHCLITGAYFGGFQALMPLLGFLLASSFASYIQKFDHWIACVRSCSSARTCCVRPSQRKKSKGTIRSPSA